MLYVVTGILPWFILAYLVSPASEREMQAEAMIDQIKSNISVVFSDESPEYQDGRRRWVESIHAKMKRYYDPSFYEFSFLFLMLVTVIFYLLIYSSFASAIGFDSKNYQFFSVPPTIQFGFIGAWLFSLFSILRRYRNFDISPSLVLNIGFHMIIASTIAFFASAVIDDNLEKGLAFFIGFIPYTELVSWARSTAESKLGAKAKIDPAVRDKKAKEQSLLLIDGITRSEEERFGEEGMWSIQHLAFSNAIKLHLTMGYPMGRVIDWIDQAQLRIFVGDEDAEKLKKMGIRGAIELAQISRASKDLGKDFGDKFKAALAKSLGISGAGLDYLIYQVREDEQVLFNYAMWELYGGS